MFIRNYRWQILGVAGVLSLFVAFGFADEARQISFTEGQSENSIDKSRFVWISESFEGSWSPAPTGWILISVSTGVYTWHQDADATSPDGSSCASVQFYSGAWYQEEFLQTPTLDLSTGDPDVYVSFYFKGNYEQSVTNDGCDLKLQISTDGGSTFPTTLWQEDNIGEWTTDEWKHAVVSLAGYNIPNIALWWRYTGKFAGIDGDEFSIDMVEVFTEAPANPAIHVTNLNGTGEGSLYEAMLEAVNIPGEDSILFDVDGIIALTTQLPELTTDGTVIAGSSAPSGAHFVTIDASGLSSGSAITINSSNNIIEGLQITGAPEDGISILEATSLYNTITGNTIYENGGLAIDLVDAGDDSHGVTPNDVGDGDNGPNDLLNYPEIGWVRSSLLSGDFFVYGSATPNATIEFFTARIIEDGNLIYDYVDPSGHGEGVYLGNIVCDGAGEFNYAVPVEIREYSVLTATATDALGNTSELSLDVLLIPTPCVIIGHSFGDYKSDCPSVIDIRVIDPDGNKLGYDINGTLYEEIPNAEYHETSGCDDSVYIPDPILGTYVIEVVADRNYTPGQGDTPTYTIDIQLSSSPPDTLAESVNIPEGVVDSCNYFIGWMPYVCGDANGDEIPNVGDAVFLINYVFNGGPAPDPIEAGDANCDENTNVGDAVYLINYVFKGGPAPCASCP